MPSDTVVGQLKPVPAAELGLRPGVPIVIGAGDRQCEVLGSGASEHHPMVSWGTTANVSVPVQERPVPSPAGAVVTRAADGGWLLEGGLSAAGSFLAWLGRLLDRNTEELGRLAAESGPGPRAAWSPCRGSTAPAPRGGATTPGPGFMGLGAAHGAADMARAVVESVAWDVVRVMEVVTVGRLGGSTAEGVTLGGAGSGLPVWVEVLTSVLGLPALRHRSGEAASAGAALLAGKALGMGLTLDQIDPVAAVIEPTPSAVEFYRALRPRVDHVAEAVLAATESLPGYRSARALTVRVELAYGRHGTSVEVPDGAEVIAPVDEPGLDGRGGGDHWRRCASPGSAGRSGPDRRRGPGGRRLPRPDAPDAEPHRAAAAAGRAGALRGARRPHHAAVRHRDAPAGHRGRDGGARRARDRRRATPSSITTARATAHVAVGEVDGTPVLLQREYVEADLRIVTGFVEPHFFAGFSGGPKAVCPGLAANATILEAHHPRRIADARATFVTRDGQPRARLRAGRHCVGAAPPLRRRRHQPGPPGHGRLRRPAACGARCRLRPRAVHRRARRSTRRSTSSCRRTAATRSTATSTRR